MDRCIAAGAAAYIDARTSTCDDLLRALEMLARGERAVSAELLTSVISPSRPPEHERLRPLSTRERQVLAWVSAGADNGVIAKSLQITERTVKAHVSSLYRKLHQDNRTQLALLARHRRSPAARDLRRILGLWSDWPAQGLDRTIEHPLGISPSGRVEHRLSRQDQLGAAEELPSTQSAGIPRRAPRMRPSPPGRGYRKRTRSVRPCSVIQRRTRAELSSSRRWKSSARPASTVQLRAARAASTRARARRTRSCSAGSAGSPAPSEESFCSASRSD